MLPERNKKVPGECLPKDMTARGKKKVFCLCLFCLLSDAAREEKNRCLVSAYLRHDCQRKKKAREKRNRCLVSAYLRHECQREKKRPEKKNRCLVSAYLRHDCQRTKEKVFCLCLFCLLW